MFGKKKPKTVHLRGVKSMAECGKSAKKDETTAKLIEVTCVACQETSRFQRLAR